MTSEKKEPLRVRANKTCWDLISQGIPPTRSRVRSVHLDGSDTTISSSINHFWEELGEFVVNRQSLEGLPDEFIALFYHLMDEALRLARGSIVDETIGLTEELEKIKQESRSLQSVIEEGRAEIIRLEKAWSSEKQKGETQVEQCKAEINRLNEKIVGLKANHDGSEKILKQTHHRLDRVERERNRLQSDLAVIKQQCNDVTRQNRVLERQCHKVEKAYDKAQLTVVQLKSRQSDHLGTIQRLKRQMTGLRATKERVGKDLVIQQTLLKNQKKETQTLKRALARSSSARRRASG